MDLCKVTVIEPETLKDIPRRQPFFLILGPYSRYWDIH